MSLIGTAQSPNLNWRINGGIFSSGWNPLQDKRVTYEINDDYASLIIDGDAPGKCLTCGLVATPCCICCPILCPLILSDSRGYMLSFSKKTEDNTIEFKYRVKHFWSEEVQVLNKVKHVYIFGEVKLDNRKHAINEVFTSEKHAEFIHITIDHEAGTFHLPPLARNREIEWFISETKFRILGISDEGSVYDTNATYPSSSMARFSVTPGVVYDCPVSVHDRLTLSSTITHINNEPVIGEYSVKLNAYVTDATVSPARVPSHDSHQSNHSNNYVTVSNIEVTVSDTI